MTLLSWDEALCATKKKKKKKKKKIMLASMQLFDAANYRFRNHNTLLVDV